ncbi:hypothetical protein [Acidiphilium sp. MT5]
MMLADPLDRPFFWLVAGLIAGLNGGLIAGLALLIVGHSQIRED